jgi:hypothetical protein
VKVEWGGIVDSEKYVSKKSKGGGAGDDPLVKYRLASNHPGGPPVAGAPRREWYLASQATRIDGASLARGISTF